MSSRLRLLTVWSILCISNVFGVITDPQNGVADNCKFFKNETEPDLVLTTPGFDNGLYPDNTKCSWIIESPEQAAGITIRFHYFDLEPTKRCSKYDYVMVYAQGNGESTWKQLGAEDGYCGRHNGINITETTKRVLIIFRSDETRRFQGFNATFSIQITQAKPRITCLSLLENTVEGGNCNRTISKEAGDFFLVQCKARAIPPAKYKWEKRFNATHWVPIRDHIVKNIFPNGSIQFHQVEESDLGQFRCHAENKHGSDEEMFQLFVKEKCPCPKEIRMSWYDYPPYTTYQTGTDNDHGAIYKGIFYVILAKMFDDVCGKCTKGHGPSILNWDMTRNKKKRLLDVKKEIEEESADIYFPIEGGKFDDKYRNIFYFIPAVESPGVAFLVPGIEEGASAMAIFDSVLEGKPILILTVIMAMLAGIIMWMLDTYWNEEQFPRKFGEGIAEGFWWAFVTMTTVGYGDISPVGVPGRLFAVVWILTGLVIIAIFTGVITTSLTVVALSSNVKLYGTSVGAMNNTKEFRMGVVKNAKMTTTSSFEELSWLLAKRDIEGALLDAYVAAYHGDKFGKFRVNNIIQAPKAFGIVLGTKLSTKYLYGAFKDYFEKNKATITKDVEENTLTLKEPLQSAAEEASSDLFNPKSKLFVNSVVVTCILLVVFSIAGIGFQVLYLDPRNRMIEAAKKLEMVDSLEVKKMAARSKIMKDVLLAEVRLFYASWGDRLFLMTKRHKEEQKKLMAKGSTPAPIRSKPPPHATAPPVEEAIEIEDNSTKVEESSRPPSSATTFSNKSTASLIRDDSPAADNPAFDDEDGKHGEPSPPPAYSAVSVRSQPPPSTSAAQSTSSLQSTDNPVSKSSASLRPNSQQAKSNVSLNNLSGSSSPVDSPGAELTGSQISVKPLIEDDEESKV